VNASICVCASVTTSVFCNHDKRLRYSCRDQQFKRILSEVCVCVREREREEVCVCVCVCV